jgi:hypothetical protein
VIEFQPAVVPTADMAGDIAGLRRVFSSTMAHHPRQFIEAAGV